MIKIFVINLATSTQRRANISRQLDALGLDYEVVDAVNGKQEYEQLVAFYDDAASLRRRGKSLTPGQLGCYASHYRLWQRCIALNEPVLILEDDAYLYPQLFLEFIKQHQQLAEKFACVRLFEHKRKHFSSYKTKAMKHFDVRRYSKGHMSTTGYFLTPKGAQIYLDNSTKWCFPVDIMMDRFWQTGLPCYGTSPACLTNDIQFQSDIGYQKITNRRFSDRCKRELFNLSEVFWRQVYNFKNRF